MSFLSNFWHRNARALSVGFFLATRQVRRSSKWTTGLIIFIMILTFLNLVVVSGLLVGLLTGSYEQYRESYSGDVLVTPKPGRTYIENTSGILSYLDNQPEVLGYSARYATTGSVLGDLINNPLSKEKANQSGAGITGFDPDKEEALTNFSRFIIQGETLKTGDDDYILIGKNLIKEYSSFADVDIPGLDLLRNIKPGDKVRVTFSGGEEGSPVVKNFIVKGILGGKVDQISQRMFVTASGLRRLLPVNQWEMQEIAIATQKGQDKQVSENLKTFIKDSPVRVQTSLEAIPTFLRQIETTFGILGNALSSIALVVASITIFIVIFINAITRRKFIGIMKGIGIEPRAIQVAYVFQAIFYAVIGSGIGLILTFGLLRPYFYANPIDFPFSDGILDVSWAGAMIRVAILLFVTLIAGFVPATMIVRKNTLDSILGR